MKFYPLLAMFISCHNG